MTTSLNKKLPLAVIGSSSMVGSRFCELSVNTFDLLKVDLNAKIHVDITSRNSIDKFFKNFDFKYLVLFSAFTDVNEAENQRGDKKGLCWQINVQGVKNIANYCLKYKRKLVFISTDFVFDGIKGQYQEDDFPGEKLDKLTWYGITKLEAEKIIQSKLSNFIIIRISYPYRAYFLQKEDFARLILRKYQENRLYPMYKDQIITPTFIDDLSPSLKLLILKNHVGIFHLASPLKTTPFVFAKEIISVFGGDISKIKEGSILKTGNLVPRPINTSLNVRKITKLGFTPTSWKTGIRMIFKQLPGKLI